MAEHLTEEDVRNIATYARIGLDEQELAQMTVDLNSIIDTLGPITIRTRWRRTHVPPHRGLSNVMREDVVERVLLTRKALENAPKQQDGSFLIPAILGGGDQ
ncbi:MAG: Asp-tRNA(Asn)/Glu-tRNA(Gln) amidotransferase subunit GatC [Slackia sp.]